MWQCSIRESALSTDGGKTWVKTKESAGSSGCIVAFADTKAGCGAFGKQVLLRTGEIAEARFGVRAGTLSGLACALLLLLYPPLFNGLLRELGSIVHVIEALRDEGRARPGLHRLEPPRRKILAGPGPEM